LGIFFCQLNPLLLLLLGETLKSLVNEAWLVIVKAEWRGEILGVPWFMKP